MNLLYISDSFVGLSVFASQVHTLCNYHAEHCNVSLLAMCHPKEVNKSGLKDAKYHLAKMIRFPKSFIPAINMMSAHLFGLRENKMLFTSADVIHCRGHVAAAFALNVLKCLHLKKPVIADIRGEMPEEIFFSSRRFAEFYRRQTRNLERYIFENADILFFVSSAMEEHYSERYQLKKDRLHVFPTIVDEKLFFKSDEYRRQTRQKLDFGGKYVYGYVGGTHSWQNLDKILRTFHDVCDSTDQFHLLTIVSDLDHFHKLQEQLQIEIKNLTVVSVPYREVPLYLNACDAGIIIRDDNVINRVACPTKIREYAACGLKIITSLEELGQPENNNITPSFFMSLDNIIKQQKDIYQQSMNSSHR